MRVVVVVSLAMVMGACTEKKPDGPIPRAKPQPLEPLERVLVDAGDERERLHQIVPFAPVGPPVPRGAVPLRLVGDTLPEVPAGDAPLLLVAENEDVYLVQIAPLLEQLDDAKREVWLAHPDAAVAFRLTLRDAAAFQAWIDEPVPGKVRVIHRADGFELQTNLGKLPGADANGPTVPVRGGKMDLTTLQRGFVRVQAKFKSAPDVCFVPSFGMEVRQIARAMSVNYAQPELPFFPSICLVYPRAPPKK
ncbi:MAG: hypothetical protein ACOZQL_35840 [Myxococcota bacterium]